MHAPYGTRLLSIGEIFDRAVHITIANLMPLAAIVGLAAVPVHAIADWIDRAELSRDFGAAGKIVANPRLFGDYFSLARDPHPHFDWFGMLWFVASIFPTSLAIAAASIASQEFLNGEKPTFGAVYRSAIRRLVPIIGANVLILATYLATILVGVIAVVAIWIVWLLIVKAGGGTTQLVPAVGVTALLFVVLAAAIVWITPLADCATTGAALYATRPFRALREAWAMTMSRGLRRRSFAFGAALLALVLVKEFIRLALCGFLSDVMHASWLSFVASDVITLLTLIFGMAVAVVFYLDSRNRTTLIQDPLAEQENSQAR
jgi:hypothetical protein